MSFHKLRLLTAGESHGPALTAILEGLPSGLPVSPDKLQHQMRRRQLGIGRGARMKIESDQVEITGGLRFGKTIGSPLSILIRNQDFASWVDVMSPFAELTGKRAVHRPRPGHADLAGGQKYGEKDLRNVLERASARESAARVACGSICRQLLECVGIEIASHVLSIAHLELNDCEVSWNRIAAIQDSETLRCTDSELEKQMIDLIEQAKSAKETVGGSFQVVARNVPPGLGSATHWDRKLDGRVAQAMLSVPAVKGVLIGNALVQSQSPGSKAHDEIFYDTQRGFFRSTNRAGGIEGGITNGEEIRVACYMKPLSTLMKPLHSVDVITKAEQDAVVERSDVCAVPAAGVVAEAMLALVLTDSILEKFASDSISELTASLDYYRNQLRSY